jgi:23S rRNA (cytosine1962-C5)-methyltransferase
MIRLKPHRDASVRAGHPWLFSGAIASVTDNPADGDTVRVEAADGTFLGWGLFNARSQIRVRVYSLREDELLTDGFFRCRIARAIGWRRSLFGDASGRIIASEGDGLSGLTVDRYNDTLVIQLTALGLAVRKDLLTQVLVDELHPRGIVLRTEQGIRAEEGLELNDGVLWGNPDETATISENGILFDVNLMTGQKTGFYHDQRDNRLRTRDFARGRNCLDMCTYTGGFALNMARAGAASVLGVDVSANALAIAATNAERNQLPVEWRKGDAFTVFPALREEGKRFGLIVLDPPKFTRSKGAEAQALKGYLSLNELALGVLEPGGILFTCSCSGRITRESFREVLQRVARHSGRSLRILEQRGAGPDHPVDPACPESEYLKCFIVIAD